MQNRLPPNPAALSRDQFVVLFGGIYEHSPWIAAAAYDRGIAADCRQPAQLAAALAAVVEAAPQAQQLALLRAHPELVGKLALAGQLTVDSSVEQASAGLDRCSPEEFAEFQLLNGQYNRTFGFPFIIAVRGLSRAAVLDAFRARSGNSPQTEFRTALDQVHRIARLRLEALASG